jgi:hypothetical protein
MSKWNENNLFDPCTELECYNHDDGPIDCTVCLYGRLREKVQKQETKLENAEKEKQNMIDVMTDDDLIKADA